MRFYLPPSLMGSRLLRCLAGLLFVTFLFGMLLGITLITNTDSSTKAKMEANVPVHEVKHVQDHPLPGEVLSAQKRTAVPSVPEPADKKPISQSNQHLALESYDAEEKFPEPNYNVHVFYYHWYGTPVLDGQYYHWNHEYLPHWEPKEAAKWPKGRHVPPDDIGSNYYPELGPYSSSDPDVINKHMIQIRKAGIGVLAISWYPPSLTDDSGKPGMSDSMIPALLDAADRFQLKVCFHIEPYEGRDIKSLRGNISYIITKYASHPAFYWYLKRDKKLPFFYIYDSYHISVSEWSRLLKPDGDFTVRNTELDSVFVGLLVEPKHQTQLLVGAGFNGFYTYFASEGFSFGSKTHNWKSFNDFASSHGALFVPSVGPGYVDDRVRPWNSKNTKSREDGKYYERYWKAALEVKPPVISITSFNEWHEGTQIEASVPKNIKGYKYDDYQPHEADYYLSLTRSWSHRYRQLMKPIS